MKAKAQQARAEVIQAEAEVPKALAQALREGNMGFMDYYKLENLKGDTAMRDTIAKINPNDVLNGLKGWTGYRGKSPTCWPINEKLLKFRNADGCISAETEI